MRKHSSAHSIRSNLSNSTLQEFLLFPVPPVRSASRASHNSCVLSYKPFPLLPPDPFQRPLPPTPTQKTLTNFLDCSSCSSESPTYTSSPTNSGTHHRLSSTSSTRSDMNIHTLNSSVSSYHTKTSRTPLPVEQKRDSYALSVSSHENGSASRASCDFAIISNRNQGGKRPNGDTSRHPHLQAERATRKESSMSSNASRQTHLPSATYLQTRESCGHGGESANRMSVSTARNIIQNVGIPGWTAISASINGRSFTNMEFYVVADDASAFANRASLEKTCPLLLQKIDRHGALYLDGEEYDADGSLGMKSKSSCSRLQPAGGLKRRTESSYVQTQRINPSQMINYSPLPWKRKPKHRIADDSKQEAESDTAFTKQDESVTRDPLRVNVYGCNIHDFRALLFYIYTSQYRFVDLTFTKTKSSNKPSLDDPAGCGQQLPFVISSTQKIASQTGNEKEGTTPLKTCRHKMDHCKHVYTSPSLHQADQMSDVLPLFSAHAAFSLSHSLNLPELKQAAYVYILGHLQSKTAMAHYLSPFARRYEMIQNGCLEFMKKHWSDIRQQPETQEALARLAQGEFPQGHRALFQLLGCMEMNNRE